MIGAFCDFSCAAWRRRMRISSACARRMRAIDTPNVSACSIARMNVRRSSTCGALVERAQRVGAARAHAGLLQHPAGLFRQRTRAPPSRCARAPARNRDRPRPRSRAGRACRAAGARSPRGGAVMRPSSTMSGPKKQTPHAKPTHEDREQRVAAQERRRERDPDDARRDAEHLEDQEAVDLVAGRAPGEHDLALDVLDVADRRDAAARGRVSPAPTGASTRSPTDSSISWSRTSTTW